MAKQTIDGDNNVQVGKVEGDLRLERRTPIMRKDDPNVVRCPFGCGQLTWYDAEECWNCTRRVKDHYVARERRALLETRNIQIAISGALSLALLLGGDYLPESWRGYTIFLGIAGVGATVLLMKASDELRRG